MTITGVQAGTAAVPAFISFKPAVYPFLPVGYRQPKALRLDTATAMYGYRVHVPTFLSRPGGSISSVSVYLPEYGRTLVPGNAYG